MIANRKLEKLQRLQASLASWEEAAQAAPSLDHMAYLRDQVKEAQRLLDETTSAYRTSAVQKACVYGWTVIAQDEGVAPRVLHAWHKEYCPTLEDLSAIPQVVPPRIQAVKEKIAREAEKVSQEVELVKLVAQN